MEESSINLQTDNSNRREWRRRKGKEESSIELQSDSPKGKSGGGERGGGIIHKATD